MLRVIQNHGSPSGALEPSPRPGFALFDDIASPFALSRAFCLNGLGKVGGAGTPPV